jgi:hypothetical protein
MDGEVNNYDIVVVTWHDAHAVTETWTSLRDFDTDPCVVRSVGYLIPNVKDDHVVLAQSIIDANDDYDSVLAIPIGMVHRVTICK